MIRNRSKHSWNIFRHPSKPILLGSSSIKDIYSNKLIEVSVVSKSVGTIKDIQITITNYIFKDDKYKTMTLVVRGNDFNSTPPTAVAEIGDIYAKMSESSFCGRIQCIQCIQCILGLISSDVTEKITAVNAGFQVTCDAKG